MAKAKARAAAARRKAGERGHVPPALKAYRFISAAAAPLAPRFLAWRLERGKENAQRLGERRGEPSLLRPAGPLIWVHAASVGEMLAVIPLIAALRARSFAVLVTSGTVTSAALAQTRLPPGVLHQFMPLDMPRYVERFLDHWRPDLVLFVESDLWPNMILACARAAIPMILVNGRLSQRSFDRWRRIRGTIAALLARFDLCLTQSSADAERYAQLGAPRVSSSGNLKLDVPAPPADQTALSKLKTAIGVRLLIAAASTHAGEEEAIIAAHGKLRGQYPSLLTIITPRHPARGQDVLRLAQAAGLSAALRSEGALPQPDLDIYVADTLGELGVIYRVAPVVFMGGSLARHGGQNPIEAAKLGAAILHGPHVWNFAEIYAALDESRGAERVDDVEALTAQLAAWIAKPAARAAVAAAAKTQVEALGGALERTLAALEPYLVQLTFEQRAS